MNYKEVLQNIKKEIAPLYIFYGDEIYIKEQTLSYLEKTVCSEDFVDFNKLILTNETLTPSAVSDFFDSYPVMADKKLLIIKDAPLFYAKTAGYDSFIKLFSAIPPYVCVVINSESIEKSSKLYKAIEKSSIICDFSYLDPLELKQRISKKLLNAEKNMNDNDISFFLGRCSQSLTDIYLQLDKLIAYSGKRSSITKDDIEKNIVPPLLNRIYDISDAILSGKADYAINLLSDLKKAGESGIRILSILGGYFADLSLANAIVSEGFSYSEAVNTMKDYLPSNRKFMANKLIEKSKNINKKFVERCLSVCVKEESNIKNGISSEWQTLELIVLKMLSYTKSH